MGIYANCNPFEGGAWIRPKENICCVKLFECYDLV